MGSTPLQTIFRHLDCWRHLPAYQLERRADIFFSAYLSREFSAALRRWAVVRAGETKPS